MIQIDNNSSKALYEQICDEFKKLILSKALKPDEQLPSVRELAAMIKVNPNTIQKAYKMLEFDNYIYTVKGKGNFVKDSDDLRKIQIQDVEKKLEEAVESLMKLGFKDDYIIGLVKKVLSKE